LEIPRNTSTSSQNGKTASLCASSKRKLDAYRARPLEPKEGELANENNEMFEEILQSKLMQKESLIDQTHKSQEAWIRSTLAKYYVCLKPMDGYKDIPVEEMVRIEEKDDLSNCPIPNRTYKIPRALLPSLEKFIVEMKNSLYYGKGRSIHIRIQLSWSGPQVCAPGHAGQQHASTAHPGLCCIAHT
jgi:hypothetical protein